MEALLPGAWSRMGTDPELFLAQDGEIIGSEHVVPAKGLRHATHPRIQAVRDGVQVELHTIPTGCRQSFSCYISWALTVLRLHLAAHNATHPEDPPIEVSWEPVVTLSERQFGRLGDSARLLGCAPSFSAYGSALLECPPDYRVRSAGGHLHLAPIGDVKVLHADPQPLVHLLDVIVGNTCVLLDRAERAAERRELYGRAGEFRLPPYGIEYRTLSNFWLRSRILTSLVLAMTRQVATIWADDGGASLLAKVDLGHVQETINSNNAEWARQTLEVVHDYQEKVLIPRREVSLLRPAKRDDESWAFLPANLGEFLHFAARGPAFYWPTFGEDLALNVQLRFGGWESYRDQVVSLGYASAGLRRAAS